LWSSRKLPNAWRSSTHMVWAMRGTRGQGQGYRLARGPAAACCSSARCIARCLSKITKGRGSVTCNLQPVSSSNSVADRLRGAPPPEPYLSRLLRRCPRRHRLGGC
jgi:hypothetical protein